ncbi:MAG: AsmA family protein [Proteobacteria bacterium]|nr:AsmA family protein [Pseudomonadota bacterium]MBU1649645.1 AsmA family protein [Pseudomonadota bacterium]
MKKIIKFCLLGAGVILGLAVAVVVYVVATFNPNNYKGKIIEAVKESTQRTLSIGGDIKLSLFPNIGAELGKVSLSDFKSDSEFSSVDNVHVSLALMPLLSRQVVVDEVMVSGVQAVLVKHKDGTTNIDDLLAKEEKGSKGIKAEKKEAPGLQGVKLDIAAVSLEKTSLTYRDEATGAQYIIKDLHLTTGRIANGLPTELNLAVGVQANQPRMDIATQLKTTLTLDLDKKQYQLEGMDLQVSASALDIGDLKLLAGGDKQANESVLIAMKGSLQVDAAKESLQLDLAGGLLQSQVKIKVGMNGFSSPAIHFDVEADQFDADQYLPEKAEKTAEVSKATEEKALDLSGLRKLNLDGSLRVGSLKVANVKLAQVRVDVKAESGQVNLAPLSANLYDGSLNGSLGINAQATPSISIKQNLTGINVASLTKDAANFDTLEGKGDIGIGLTMQGNTVSEMKKAMHGIVSLNLTDGAIKGINIAKHLRDAKNVLSMGGASIQTQSANSAEKTDFSELKATFKVNKGVAHNNDLSLKSPLLCVLGSGDINIGNDSMDYLAKATLANTLEGQGGQFNVSGITVPVRAKGPFSNLQYTLDFGVMVGEAAKQKIETEVKAKVQDQLKKSLQGFFK